ncbi:hypothetical protein [Desulfococcus sp.]|uniref:hypothetical protein n=1 Tax=Desulfococcus sp. TaxID=2025834 RepID=UPI00359490DC
MIDTRKTLLGMMVLAVVMLFFSCAGTATKSEPSANTFKPPVITLDHVEIAHYWGWWYYAKDVPPTKGTAGDYGAPLDMAFIFNMENPNPYSVLLESLSFTVAFDEFDVNVPSAIETQWIPAGKTNQLRVHSIIDGRQTLLSLMVTGGFKLKEKGVSAFDQLEKWWTGAPEFAFPVHVNGGTAVFSADTVSEVVPFSFVYPEATRK